MSIEGDQLPYISGANERRLRNAAPRPQAKTSPVWSEDEWMKRFRDAGMIRSPVVDAVLSRRGFLTGAATLATAAVADNTFTYSSLAKWLNDKVVGQFNYDEAVKEAKHFMKERYGVTLRMGVDKHEKDITGNPVALEQYRTSLRLLVQEMSKYPPEMIRKIGEGRGFEIRISNGLYTKGDTVADHSHEKKKLGGVAPLLKEKKSAQMMLDSQETEVYQRQTMHHELNHRAAAKWEDGGKRDQTWVKFHSKASPNPYHEVSINAITDQTKYKPYFLKAYAGSAPIEDEAVFAEYMMMPQLHVEVLNKWRNEKDPVTKDILAAKYLETKKNYLAWSDGKIDDAFWKAIIAEGERQVNVAK